MYKLPPPPSTGVVRISDGAFIPPDERNKHWRAYLAWVAAGNIAAPYVEPAEVTAAKVEWQRERTEAAELRADTKFQNLTGRTPAQTRNWVENSFPSLTLAEQRDLATIVNAISILARRL